MKAAEKPAVKQEVKAPEKPVAKQEVKPAQNVQNVQPIKDVKTSQNEEKKARKSRLPVILVSVLGVIAVVAIVVVAILRPWEDNVTEEIVANKDNMSVEANNERVERYNQALLDCNEIERNYNTGTVGYDNTISDFNSKMLSSDPVYNIYFAICYTSFLNSSGDSSDALEVLKKVESQLENVNSSITVDYYVTLSLTYKKLGDNEMVDYYNSKINDLMNEGEGVEKTEVENE